ncbi:hypothetical protein DK28_0215655 [Peptococcaceae bacterium SCADC1_2_3]|nr:hypothetical protein DK28_0215655 [Peptococcaceae bacterium SCADC1_2_3]KFI34747.1 hypothetical protein HY00_09970 [Peptococcaceae bacterium SCADC1_2_3]
MAEEKAWLREKQATKAIEGFRKRRINAQYVKDKGEALSTILQMIPPGGGVTVGVADSVTLHQIGVISKLKSLNQNEVFDPFERDDQGFYTRDIDTVFKVMRRALTADYFLTGANAITLDGKIISTDGTGNRVAAMIFGPKKVIIVVGVNKIVKDAEEGIRRIREVAAPMNAVRHLIKHHNKFGELPCVRTGFCVDCNHPRRNCHYTVIVEGAIEREKDRNHIIIVGEELGF